jgi:hypothetical protein
MASDLIEEIFTLPFKTAKKNTRPRLLRVKELDVTVTGNCFFLGVVLIRVSIADVMAFMWPKREAQRRLNAFWDQKYRADCIKQPDETKEQRRRRIEEANWPKRFGAILVSPTITMMDMDEVASFLRAMYPDTTTSDGRLVEEFLQDHWPHLTAVARKKCQKKHQAHTHAVLVPESPTPPEHYPVVFPPGTTSSRRSDDMPALEYVPSTPVSSVPTVTTTFSPSSLWVDGDDATALYQSVERLNELAHS